MPDKTIHCIHNNHRPAPRLQLLACPLPSCELQLHHPIAKEQRHDGRGIFFLIFFKCLLIFVIYIFFVFLFFFVYVIEDLEI